MKDTRRDFLKTGAMALAGITIAPSSILGMSHGHVSPSDKLNIAAVGIGGMGHANINTTQVYAQITEQKISQDMDKLIKRRKTMQNTAVQTVITI